ncbi:hypothetical protein AU194_20265 [Mycobacterium sp. GA-2829]|nr:hypothetical protein AU194_20265 [Mycobacterium sp. GA-2829]
MVVASEPELTETAVKCQALGNTLTKIAIGSPANGIDITLDNASGVAAKSLIIRDVGGFTGSFWEGLQGTAESSVVGGTIKIDGDARGYATREPSLSKMSDFRISVAC